MVGGAKPTESAEIASRSRPPARLPSASAILFSGEAVRGCSVVRGAGFQFRGWESGLVGRVGVVLSLHAEGAAQGVGLAAFPLDRPIQEVAGIKLEARFGGPDLHRAAGFGVANFGGFAHAAVAFVEHPVVVVAFAELELPIVLADACADGSRLG